MFNLKDSGRLSSVLAHHRLPLFFLNLCIPGNTKSIEKYFVISYRVSCSQSQRQKEMKWDHLKVNYKSIIPLTFMLCRLASSGFWCNGSGPRSPSLSFTSASPSAFTSGACTCAGTTPPPIGGPAASWRSMSSSDFVRLLSSEGSLYSNPRHFVTVSALYYYYYKRTMLFITDPKFYDISWLKGEWGQDD